MPKLSDLEDRDCQNCDRPALSKENRRGGCGMCHEGDNYILSGAAYVDQWWEDDEDVS